MFLIIHAGHLNLAHYNFAVTPQLRLMRFMLNINKLYCFLLFMKDAESYFSPKRSKKMINRSFSLLSFFG